MGTHVVQVARPGFVPKVERVTLTPTSPAATLTITLRARIVADRATPGRPPGRASAAFGVLEIRRAATRRARDH